MKSEVYISVDVETSGPIPGTYSMLSIGACEIGNPTTSFYCELKPINDKSVPSAIATVGRPLSLFDQTGKHPRQAMTEFREWISDISAGRSAVLVGFNVGFDWSFVNWYFLTYLNRNPFGVTGVDIKSMYMGKTGCSWSDTTLDRISKRLNIQIPHTHHALTDAIGQAQLFEIIREKNDR